MPKPTLKERMTAAAGPAPSMVPQQPQVVPPPAKEEEPPPPQLKELVKDKKDLLQLARLIEEDMPWKEMASQAAKARKPIEAKIKNLLGKHEVGLAMIDDIRVNYYSGTRTTISEKLLLANGVQPSVILSSRESKSVFTLKISRGKEDEDES